MNKLAKILSSILLLSMLSNFAWAQSVDSVVSLVKVIRLNIEKDAIKTISVINKRDQQYKDSENKSLYVFVIDDNNTIVAHGYKPERVGVNMNGEKDSNGKEYALEIYNKAMTYKKGWSDYIYTDPNTGKDSNKLSYFEQVKGSDGKIYIVGSGLYYDK